MDEITYASSSMRYPSLINLMVYGTGQFSYLGACHFKAGGSHLGAEYNSQVPTSMQVDRGSSWMSGPPDSSTMTQLAGPPQFNPGQMAQGNQPSRTAPVLFLNSYVLFFGLSKCLLYFLEFPH